MTRINEHVVVQLIEDDNSVVVVDDAAGQEILLNEIEVARMLDALEARHTPGFSGRINNRISLKCDRGFHLMILVETSGDTMLQEISLREESLDNMVAALTYFSRVLSA